VSGFSESPAIALGRWVCEHSPLGVRRWYDDIFFHPCSHPHQRPRGRGDDFARAPTGAPPYGRV